VPGAAVSAFLIGVGCLVLAGLVIQLLERRGLVPLYVLASLAIICLWPWGFSRGELSFSGILLGRTGGTFCST
jgi:hypothetical protein